jgi:hypothetical protein
MTSIGFQGTGTGEKVLTSVEPFAGAGGLSEHAGKIDDRKNISFAILWLKPPAFSRIAFSWT